VVRLGGNVPKGLQSMLNHGLERGASETKADPGAGCLRNDLLYTRDQRVHLGCEQHRRLGNFELHALLVEAVPQRCPPFGRLSSHLPSLRELLRVIWLAFGRFFLVALLKLDCGRSALERSAPARAVYFLIFIVCLVVFIENAVQQMIVQPERMLGSSFSGQSRR